MNYSYIRMEVRHTVLLNDKWIYILVSRTKNVSIFSKIDYHLLQFIKSFYNHSVYTNNFSQ